MDTGFFLQPLNYFVILGVIFSIAMHEAMHGYAAYYLCDPTARNAGRITLNPLAHIDLWSTILLPILLLAQGLPAFGGAKPVPVRPDLFTRNVTMRQGFAIVSMAGPLSNFTIAVGCSLILHFIRLVRYIAGMETPHVAMEYVFGMILIANIGLCIFNLVPIPPLDGSRVVAYILRSIQSPLLEAYESLERWGLLIILVLILFIRPFTYMISSLSGYVAIFLGIDVYSINSILSHT